MAFSPAFHDEIFFSPPTAPGLDLLIPPARAVRNRFYITFGDHVYDLALSLEAYRDWYCRMAGVDCVVIAPQSNDNFFAPIWKLHHLMMDDDINKEDLIWDPLAGMYVSLKFWFGYFGVEEDVEALFAEWEPILLDDDTCTTSSVTLGSTDSLSLPSPSDDDSNGTVEVSDLLSFTNLNGKRPRGF